MKTSSRIWVAQLEECLTQARCSTDVGVARDFFPESPFSADALTVSHVLASVRTLKIPNTGSHTVVWTQENTTHIDRNVR